MHTECEFRMVFNTMANQCCKTSKYYNTFHYNVSITKWKPLSTSLLISHFQVHITCVDLCRLRWPLFCISMHNVHSFSFAASDDICWYCFQFVLKFSRSCIQTIELSALNGKPSAVPLNSCISLAGIECAWIVFYYRSVQSLMKIFHSGISGCLRRKGHFTRIFYYCCRLFDVYFSYEWATSIWVKSTNLA